MIDSAPWFGRTRIDGGHPSLSIIRLALVNYQLSDWHQSIVNREKRLTVKHYVIIVSAIHSQAGQGSRDPQSNEIRIGGGHHAVQSQVTTIDGGYI